MKRILLIMLVVPVVCWGQKKDTITLNDGTKLFLSMDNGLTLSPPKQDTIPVIMLVCDTTATKNLNTQIMLNDYSYNLGNRYASLWWQFGYMIYEGRWVFVDGEDKFSYAKYLDQNKKPLPKSIVVWMSKEIKQ